MASPETVVCLFRVQAGKEEEFQRLLTDHWPTLRRLNLATDMPPQHFRGEEKSGEPIFVEIFEWASRQAAAMAHEHPEVAALWEPMEQLTEARDGRPPMEFPHVQPIQLHGQA